MENKISMNKKLISIVLVTVLILSGCSSKDVSSTKDNNIVGTFSYQQSFVFDSTSENVFSDAVALAFVEVKEIK